MVAQVSRNLPADGTSVLGCVSQWQESSTLTDASASSA
jgi:hypothetical protein